MSDNEDLLGDDLGDHSLADYNLGNDEEEQLLADDYESGGPQNVPSSIGAAYRGAVEIVPQEYTPHAIEYSSQPLVYQPLPEPECVVPNIVVEAPSLPERRPYPYEPDHAVVPPPIPAAPMESPQIVPSEMTVPIASELPSNGDMVARARFISERPPGLRTPQVRDIPDSLDKVMVPRGGFPQRGRTWRNLQLRRRTGNYHHRSPFPAGLMRFHAPQVRPEMRSMIRPEILDIRPEQLPEVGPPLQMGPEISPERPILPQEPFRAPIERPFQPNFPRFQFRPNVVERPFAPPRPNYDQRPYQYRSTYPRFAPPVREIAPNSVSNLPQVTIRMPDKDTFTPNAGVGREQEVRMLPVLPNLPPAGFAGKKVLINPHFKGNFQPPVEGLPTYIPTRINKSPPISPTLESKFGPIKDIDDAAERFIAEQRNALARAANRKMAARRSPQRYIENTTIEIENDLAQGRREEDDLLRRQEEFINANRAGLRRRMRSPVRRSPSPRRSPERRPRPEALRPPHSDEESEYKRRVREQETLRERVLRAKEVRRRKNAAAMLRPDREREDIEAAKLDKPEVTSKPEVSVKPDTYQPSEFSRPDTTRRSPDTRQETRPDTANVRDTRQETAVARDTRPETAIIRDNRPETAAVKDIRPVAEMAIKEQIPQANSATVSEGLTPPRGPSPARTPPLPSDDDLDLILGDIDGILSDDDDSGRFKGRPPPARSASGADLRAKLPPRSKPPRQKIVFNDHKQDKKRKEKSPPRRAVVTSSSKVEEADSARNVKKIKTEAGGTAKSRQKIVFENRQAERAKEKEIEEEKNKTQFSNRRVILQRKVTQPKESKSVFSRIEVKNDPTQPNPGIFSRAVRTAIGAENNRIVIKKDEPQIEYDSESDLDEDLLLQDISNVAMVTNLPHGMTDTRLKTLAGNEVQSLILDKEDRSAKITFKTTVAAEVFKKKFNSKMVAASRLTVVLR